MAESEKQLELKKRARRRLVGAAAFALTAAIVLPMVMDHEPRPLTQDIQIRIPSPEGTAPRSAPKAVASAPKADSKTESKPEPKPEATSPAPDLKAIEEARPNAAPADVGKAAVDTSRPTVASAAKQETAVVAKPATAVEQKKDASEQKKDTGEAKAPPKAEREAHVEAILSGKETPATGEFVVQLGAFSDPANVSKVRARVKESGFGSYTETIKSVKGEQTRVRAGPFATREAAEQAAAKLKHAGLAGVVAAR